MVTTNKEYLITMLTALEGKRDVAAGLKVLVEKSIVNEDQIMELIHIFLNVIYEANTKVNLKGLKKTIKK